MDSLIKDIRVGLRSLLKRPAFTLLAVATLALGIGASTAIFSVVDGVLLRSLPFPHAEQIVQLREISPRGSRMAFAEPNFRDLKARTHSFAALAQYNGSLTTINGGSEPVRAQTYVVSSDFFNVLEVQPAVGRLFSPEESRAGGPSVALVSYGFWQRLLGANPDLSKVTLRVMEQTVNVIGVMPQGLEFPQNAEVWLPREMFPAEVARSAHNWSVIGRLNENVSAEQALADISGIAKQMKVQNGKDMDGVDFTFIPQHEYMVGNVRQPLVLILVAVAFLLIVACANVANLLLAQMTTRQRDFAVRAALGATRFRLVRQFIIENLLLTLTAAALGVVLSFWGVKLLLRLNQQSLPRLSEIGVDTRAIFFTFGLSLLIAIVLGFVPLIRFSLKDLEKALRESGTGARGFAGRHLRSTLVVAQVALTLVLMIGAGLLARSFYRLLQIDPGFRTESVVAMELSLPDIRMNEQRYKQFLQAYRKLTEEGVAPNVDNIQLTAEEEQQRLFQNQLLDRLAATPGMIASGVISDLPLTGGGPDGTFLINNNPAKKGNAEYRLASTGYFSALNIPLLRGRMFDASDAPNAPHSAVVSQSLVQKYWPNENPIGQTIQFGNMDGDLRLLHIVGVVGDVHDYGVDQQPVPTIYGNALQRLPSSSYTIVSRSQIGAAALVPAMRGVVRELDSQLPLKFRTLDQVFSSSLDRQRFSFVIFGVFGVAALLLAALGIYGVTSYAVAQRTQEIGIRMALGAQMKDILSLVLRNAMSLVLVGALIGLAGAYAATRLMSSFLFGVKPTDIFTFVAVPLLLFVVALVASLIPARRATKVDPLVALRYE
jgi:ABC-type antimicrobial peptide transport system permease subunit